jgi:capsular exopolysaccharide synthesis family protein
MNPPNAQPHSTPTATSVPVEAAPFDARAYLAVVWRHKVAFVLCIVLIPLATYLLTIREAKQYSSSATLQVQTQNADTTLFSIDAIPSPASLLAVARLLQTAPVRDLAAKELTKATGRPASDLAGISVDTDEQSGFVTLSAQATDPQVAADSANAYANSVVRARADDARRQIDTAVAQLRLNLEQLDPDDKVGRSQLSSQLNKLRALRASQGNNARVVDPAVAVLEPISPHPERNTALALIVSLFIASGVVTLLERANRRIRDVTELEQITGVPLLAAVPDSAFTGVAAISPTTREAFLMLRTSLTYFNLDRTLRRVLITSPSKGDGKTTVAVNLAIAFARAGKTVVLIDADLRQPQMMARFGLEPQAVGLGGVLTGQVTLGEAIREIDEPGDGKLYLLPAGAPPPNPSELMASGQMRDLLDAIDEVADVTIIDTPPALVVGDAIPLMERVSGIIVVGRVSKTTRESLARLTSVVTTALGTVLGVVATGMPSAAMYGYGGYQPIAYDEPDGDGKGPSETNGPNRTPFDRLAGFVRND